MSPSQPPALANWMLRHLVLGDRTEAIEGDLLEEFQRRRSAGWYWRQVAGAIVGFSNLLRISWVMVWTAAFAAAWIYGLCFFVAHSAPSPVQIVSGNWSPNGMWSRFSPWDPLLSDAAALRLSGPHPQPEPARVCGGAGRWHSGPRPASLRSISVGHARQLSLAWSIQAAGGRPMLFRYETLQGAWPLLVGIWAATLCRKKTAPPAPSQQAPTP